MCVVPAGELIPGDGEIVEGIASVDESAITGESAPVIRESGGDRSAVTGGTRVLSDEIVVRITSKPGETFLDRMIALVEGASRQKTPNEIALNILLAGLTIIFLLATVTLQPFAIYSNAPQSLTVLDRAARVPHPDDDRRAAVGDRHRRHGPARAAQRARDERARGRGGGRLLDAAARQDRHDHLRQPPGRASSCPCPASTSTTLADAAMLSSLADETPEGRSIVTLRRGALRPDAARDPERRARAVHRADPHERRRLRRPTSIRKGAADSVRRWVERAGRRRARRARDDRRRHRDAGRHAARRRRTARACSA